MTGLAVAAFGLLVAGVVLTWMVSKRNHPDRGTSPTPEQGVKADRPAGPDAETMDPDDLDGGQAPGSPGTD